MTFPLQRFALFALCFLSASTASGFQEYYGFKRSLRALGMGGTFYALSNDEHALFYNPAGLAHYDRGNKFMLSLTGQLSEGGIEDIKKIRANVGGDNSIADTFENLASLQGKPVFGNVGLFPFYSERNKAIGVLIADTKAQFALLGRDLDAAAEASLVSDSGLFLGYGAAYNSRWAFGVNMKLFYRAGGRAEFGILDVAQKHGKIEFDPTQLGGGAGGLDFDLGAIYSAPPPPGWHILKDIRFSATLSNLISGELRFKTIGGAPPRLPRYFSLGSLLVFKGIESVERFHVLVDISEIDVGGTRDRHLGARFGSIWKHVNLGGEAVVNGWLYPRAGIHQGYVTLGIGADFEVFRGDLAWYAEELAAGPGRLTSRRIALQFAFGLSSPPEPTPRYRPTSTPPPPSAKPATEEEQEVIDAFKREQQREKFEPLKGPN